MNKKIRRQLEEWEMMFERDGFATLKRVLIPVQSNPTATIKDLRPHYTNEAFKSPQTVYLAAGYKLTPEYVKGAFYNYSDRLPYEGREEAWKVANAQHSDHNCAAWAETYLRALLNKPNLKLVHILAGFNVSNGFDYQVYGYFEEGNDA